MKKIINIYFNIKKYLKSTHNHTERLSMPYAAGFLVVKPGEDAKASSNDDKLSLPRQTLV